VGFFKVVVLPLLENYCSQFLLAQPLLDAAMANLAHWKRLEKEVADKAAAAKEASVAAGTAGGDKLAAATPPPHKQVAALQIAPAQQPPASGP
jgi:hypothetical protein